MNAPEPKIEAVKLTYSQDADCCDPTIDGVQTLDVEIADGGGGPYLVIRTERWAIDKPSDLVNLLARVSAMMPKGDA